MSEKGYRLGDKPWQPTFRGFVLALAYLALLMGLGFGIALAIYGLIEAV